MELFEPNAVLIKELISESPEEWKYMIYSETLTDHSQYVAEAYTQTTYALNTDGHYEVTLNVTKDTTIPVDMDYVKPIVHIVELTGLTLTDTNPTVEVSVYEGDQRKGKKRVLHKSVASENARPVEY